MSKISLYLLAIIGISFIVQMIIPFYTGLFIFIPDYAFSEPWRFVTSMFLHSGITHLFFNAYALFLFGTILESRVSKRDFLIIFFAAGLIGSFLYYLTMFTPWASFCEAPDGSIWHCPALGASGAIFGLLGAVAIMLPEMRIFMMFFPMKMKHAAMLWVAIEFFGTFDASSGIASAAHLGGLIFGIAYAWYLKKKIQEEAYVPPDTYETREYEEERPW